MRKFLYKILIISTIFLIHSNSFAQNGPTAPASDLQPENSALTTEIKPFFTPVETVYLKINVPATRLDLYVNNQLQKSYNVAVGMPKYPTPIQEFHISQLVWNPWWIPPESDWAKDAEKTPPGPGNPLGPVKMMMEDGVRIHGTTSPRSIGTAASHACIRMNSKEAKELAWEIQKRYSEKNDEAVLANYSKKSGQSFYVNLPQEVLVIVEYKQVELSGDKLILHPNRYQKSGFEEELQAALSDHPEIQLTDKMVQKLNQMRRQKTVEVSFAELQMWASPATATSPQHSPVDARALSAK